MEKNTRVIVLSPRSWRYFRGVGVIFRTGEIRRGRDPAQAITAHSGGGSRSRASRRCSVVEQTGWTVRESGKLSLKYLEHDVSIMVTWRMT